MLIALGGTAREVPCIRANPSAATPAKFARMPPRKLREFLAAGLEILDDRRSRKTRRTFGYPGQNSRWTDFSPASVDERRRQHLQDSLKELKAIPRDQLPAGEQLNYDLYLELLERRKKVCASTTTAFRSLRSCQRILHARESDAGPAAGHSRDD